MKKINIIIIAICTVFVLFSGCQKRDVVIESAKKQTVNEKDNTIPDNLNNDTMTNTSTGSYEDWITANNVEGTTNAEEEYCSFTSVEELVAAIRADDKDDVAQNNNLADISYLYVPAKDYDGFQLFLTEVNPYCIFLYYIPQQKESKYTSISEQEDIIVTIYRTEAFTLDSLCEQHGMSPDLDGFAYNESRGKIYFQQDDSVISISAPESMNDYDTLRSLCQMKRIEIN